MSNQDNRHVRELTAGKFPGTVVFTVLGVTEKTDAKAFIKWAMSAPIGHELLDGLDMDKLRLVPGETVDLKIDGEPYNDVNVLIYEAPFTGG